MNKFFSKRRKMNSRGFTMTEMLVVVAIIAILASIITIGAIGIYRSLHFTQMNNYAKAIYMAAQANLTDLSEQGRLGPLREAADVYAVPQSSADNAAFPESDWSNEYRYFSYHHAADADEGSFATILPVGCIDDTLRDHDIFIEFNPFSANVYSVFYSEEGQKLGYSASGDYAQALTRNEEERKKVFLGYYAGTGLDTSSMTVEKTEAWITWENGEEGIATVHVPVPSAYFGAIELYIKGLQVDAAAVSEDILGSGDPGTIEVRIKEEGKTMAQCSNCSIDTDGKTVLFTWTLDSLANFSSFANISSEKTTTAIGELKENSTGTAFAILPGDNVTLSADVTFTPDGNNSAVEIKRGVLAGVNPMYDYIGVSALSDDQFVIGVSNGRNLQNLNALHPDIASSVKTVYLSDDIDWDETVGYYNKKYAAGGSYKNAEAEAPGRQLPYFVPITSKALFGEAWFDMLSADDDEYDYSFVPVLSHEGDTAGHAGINGLNHKVYGLNIDTTKYRISSLYYAGSVNYERINADSFAGLFSYVNTTVDGVYVVNPKITGTGFTSDAAPSYSGCYGIRYDADQIRQAYNNPAAGSLVGVCGLNTVVTNCGAYLDTTHKNYDYSESYGVRGYGAVGGLIGYAMSFRTTSGSVQAAVSQGEDVLAFARCFAAVDVTGEMRGLYAETIRRGCATSVKVAINAGYSNGVGGLIGNSELTNFYDCYASGNVTATGCMVERARGSFISEVIRVIREFVVDVIRWIFGIADNYYYDGRNSMGAGGFVGTSHGTCYTNCFATGDVFTDSQAEDRYQETNICGGAFVGVMSYQETTEFGQDTSSTPVAQSTVFSSCYSLGRVSYKSSRGADRTRDNFGGVICSIRELQATNDMFDMDYYVLLAPYSQRSGSAPSYKDTFVYKDCYYYDRGGQYNLAVDCANRATYDDLANIISNHTLTVTEGRVTGYIADYINGNIYPIKRDNGQQYGNSYFNGNTTSEYTGLFATYADAMAQGFSAAEWGPATAGTTHAYSLNSSGAVYPFAKINEMDYYGTWPFREIAVGLGYYEYYSGAGSASYYLSADSSRRGLAKTAGTVVVSDGYAIMCKNAVNSVTVTINGVSAELTKKDSITLDTEGTYSTYLLTLDLMNAAAAYVNNDPNCFYAPVKATVGGVEYTMYFNPNIAVSEINPVGTDTVSAADPGSGAPAVAYIRTARQLAALSKMTAHFDKPIGYIQQFSIDKSTYTASSYAGITAAQKTELLSFHLIGTSEAPFAGSYTGKGYEAKAAIKGFAVTGDGTDAGLFGATAATSSISNLTLENISVSGEAENVGLLAGTARGSVSNITVNVTDAIANGTVIAAGKNAGGIIGKGEGLRLSGCNLITVSGKALKFSGANCGGFIGATSGEGNSVANVSMTYLCDISAEGGTAFVGGIVGAASNTDFTSININTTGTGLILSGNATGYGALAGSLSGGSVITFRADLATSISTGSVAGLASSANSAVIQDVVIHIPEGATVTGANTAGLINDAAAVRLINTEVYLRGTLEGTSSSAGAIGKIGGGSSVSLVNVRLEGGVTSSGTAAGFAGSVYGSVSGSNVLLGSSASNTSGSIIGAGNAAGFTLDSGGDISGCSVSGSGTIKATDTGNAAGFARSVSGGTGISGCTVSPVSIETSDVAAAYKASGYQKLEVYSANGLSAGFACTVSAPVRSSTAVCFVHSGDERERSQNSAGFAHTVSENSGYIDRCIADTLTNGDAFAIWNDGTVTNSYAWYSSSCSLTGTEQADSFTRDEMTDEYTEKGVYYGCYFAPLLSGTDDESRIVVLYPSKKNSASGTDTVINGKIPTVTTLGGLISACDVLNSEADPAWLASNISKVYEAYPFITGLSSSGVADLYPYPMLRVHYGNWVNAPAYTYGVAYYETHSDGKTYLQLCVGDGGIETNILTDNASSVITEAGYAILGKNDSQMFYPYSGKLEEDGIVFPGDYSSKAGNIKSTYDFYKLDTLSLIGSGAGLSAVMVPCDSGVYQIVPYYANTLVAAGGETTVYEIRTEGQFRNLKLSPSGNFKQTHDVSLTSATGLRSFSGSYNGGKSDNYKLVIDGNVSSVFGAVTSPGEANYTGVNDLLVSVGAGTRSLNNGGFLASSVSGTVSNVEVDASSADAILVNGGCSGLLTGIVNGGTITGCTVSGSLTANAYGLELGGLAGRVTAGTISGSSATGSIVKADGVAGCTVGGFIGKDEDTAIYSGDTAAVAIDAGFADASAGVSNYCPAGLGSVGKFVGFAVGGSFTNCSGTGASGAAYQFLGTVQSYDVSVDENLYMLDTSIYMRNPIYQSLKATDLTRDPAFDESIFTAVTESLKSCASALTLDNCTYLGADGNMHYQKTSDAWSFYVRSYEEAYNRTDRYQKSALPTTEGFLLTTQNTAGGDDGVRAIYINDSGSVALTDTLSFIGNNYYFNVNGSKVEFDPINNSDHAKLLWAWDKYNGESYSNSERDYYNRYDQNWGLEEFGYLSNNNRYVILETSADTPIWPSLSHEFRISTTRQIIRVQNVADTSFGNVFRFYNWSCIQGWGGNYNTVNLLFTWESAAQPAYSAMSRLYHLEQSAPSTFRIPWPEVGSFDKFRAYTYRAVPDNTVFTLDENYSVRAVISSDTN